MSKIYPFGYGPAAVGMMQSRDASTNAKLFLKYASPGMNVLDVGCGPGSISVGIAEALAPGQVTGIDIEPSQIVLGEELVKSKKMENCKFETASLLELPFEDSSFDAVYGHTILMQFSDLKPVLDEIMRVLKPGGLVGFREIDFGASLYHSENSALRKLMALFRRSFLHNEGNPDIGRSLARLLTEAGFSVKEVLASYAQASTDEQKLGMYKAMAGLWNQADFPTQALELGWITKEEKDSLPGHLELESRQPGSFSATTFVEAVAFKSSKEAIDKY